LPHIFYWFIFFIGLYFYWFIFLLVYIFIGLYFYWFIFIVCFYLILFYCFNGVILSTIFHQIEQAIVQLVVYHEMLQRLNGGQDGLVHSNASFFF